MWLAWAAFSSTKLLSSLSAAANSVSLQGSMKALDLRRHTTPIHARNKPFAPALDVAAHFDKLIDRDSIYHTLIKMVGYQPI
jgi:hypothetical protein